MKIEELLKIAEKNLESALGRKKSGSLAVSKAILALATVMTAKQVAEGVVTYEGQN